MKREHESVDEAEKKKFVLLHLPIAPEKATITNVAPSFIKFFMSRKRRFANPLRNYLEVNGELRGD